MPITEKQREARSKHIGSSDMAAVLGVDPWRGAFDVWLDKTGRLEDLEPTPAMLAGTLLEDGLLAYAEIELGKMRKNVYRVCRACPVLATHIDGVLDLSGDPVEAKLSSSHSLEHWGDVGTDDMPNRVIIQCHVHMACLGKKQCHVVRYSGFSGFGLYLVELNQDITTAIIERAEEFWECVKTDTPPEGSRATLDVLKRVRREPESVAPVEVNIVEEWIKAKEVEKQAKKYKEQMQARIIQVLGDAEGSESLVLAGVEQYLTYTETERKGIDVRRLRVEKPEIAGEYEKISKSRTLRIKKVKVAK